MTAELTATRPVRPARRVWRRTRRPFHRAMLLLHRWPGLVLGVLLVVETTSGAVLLYQSQYFRATHSSLYQRTADPNPISPTQAIDVVAHAHPGFGASWVAIDHGVYAVGEPTYRTQWFVDPGSGHLNGRSSMDGGVMGLLVNLHDCAFSCEGYPAYSSWLATPVWAGGPTFLTGITRAALILGMLGLLMVLLVLTSLRIWWPGLRKLKQRFVVRGRKGRYARDYDLHNVIGAIALPFLLMWGITGAAFEFPVVENTWLALTGGDKPAEASYSVTPNPATAKDPDIGVAAATDAARSRVPGTVSFIGIPTKAADYYEVDIISGYASSRDRAIYHGDTYVYVDAHDATNVAVFNGGTGPAANRFYDKFLEPTHFGWNVNAWWRLLWLAFGLAPLALMITGVSTWLYRRGVTKRRRAAASARTPEPEPESAAAP